MKREELTKLVMMNSNKRKPFGFKGFHKKKSAPKGLIAEQNYSRFKSVLSADQITVIWDVMCV